MSKIFQTIVSIIGGILCYLFGPFDVVLGVLICVAIIDYITGVMSAASKGKLSSRIGFVGILKKLFIFLLVALAAMLDRIVPAANQAIRATVCIFYIANESLSILENAGQMGLPLPVALKKTIEKLKEE